MIGGVLVYVHGTGWGTICDDDLDGSTAFGSVAANEFGYASCTVVDWDGTDTGYPIAYDS